MLSKLLGVEYVVNEQGVNEMKHLNDVNYKDCVGKVCKSKLSGDFKILKCNGAKDVEIQFLKTGFETTVQLGSIRNGNVKDPYSSSVFWYWCSRY